MGRQNLICNFRAPDQKHFQIWLDFKEVVQSRGLDICFVSLALCQAWLKSIEETTSTCKIAAPLQIINLQQQNTFVYGVQKPRRQPPELICPRKAYSRTITSRLCQAYVVEKARDLERSFSFRDFLELGHGLFRKCALKLKRRGKIFPLQPRTNPRFYILREWLPFYPTMTENTGVKPRFTSSSTWRDR